MKKCRDEGQVHSVEKLVDVTDELKAGTRPLNEMFDQKKIEEVRENKGKLKRG